MARPASNVATRKIFLLVPYEERAEAKALGAGYESYKSGQKPKGKPSGYWYIRPGALIAPFAKWRRAGNPFAPDPTKILETKGGKNAAAVALGSLGGRAGGHKGGKARAANLSPEELSAIGRKGQAAKQAKAAERRREMAKAEAEERRREMARKAELARITTPDGEIDALA